METEKNKPFLDIYDLCIILQSVGFVLRDSKESLEPKDTGRSVEIICNVSGKKIFLESDQKDCYCWRHAGHEDVETWETSGTSAGVQTSKLESSTSYWKELPKNMMLYILETMHTLVENIRNSSNMPNISPKQQSPLDLAVIDAKLENIKASCNLATDEPINPTLSCQSNFGASSENMMDQLKVSPSTYTSLDVLINEDICKVISEPEAVQASSKVEKKNFILRQNTYTSSPTIDFNAAHEANGARTSSPVNSVDKTALYNIVQAEKILEDLYCILKETKTIMEEHIYSDISSLAMDVSKISQPKESLPRRRNSIGHSGQSGRVGVPHAWTSPNLSRIQEGSQNVGLKNFKSSVSANKNQIPILPLQKETSKTNNLKKGIPKKISSITSMSPSFGALGSKKSFSLGSHSNKQISGTYKSLADRASIGSFGAELPGMKKKNSLYGHIKSTIITRVPSAKK